MINWGTEKMETYGDSEKRGGDGGEEKESAWDWEI